jgi:hypothetical protein
LRPQDLLQTQQKQYGIKAFHLANTYLHCFKDLIQGI